MQALLFFRNEKLLSAFHLATNTFFLSVSYGLFGIEHELS